MSVASTTSTISIDGTDSDGWIVTGIEAREAMSDAPTVRVSAIAEAESDLEAAIGKEASVTLRAASGERTFRGVVLEIAEEVRQDQKLAVEVTIAATIATLELGRDHRWFQTKSVVDIAKDVFDRAGVGDKCEWSLAGSYEPRDYVVQHGESDFAFVARILAHEGIGWFARDAADAETYVFFDDDSAFEPIEGESVLHDRFVATTASETVTLERDTWTACSDQVAQRDYDLARPAVDLTTTAEAEGAAAREVYLHPGDYVDTGRGDRLTSRTLERLRARRQLFVGQSDCARLAPGRIFTLEDAQRDSLNRDYLVIEVRHRVVPEGASGDGNANAQVYSCEFRAIPAATPFRPERSGKDPVIEGVQPAFVTVPSGEEIHSDEFGRVKVRFPWDRSGLLTDESSYWLRVGQLALGGSMILPRIDFEVLVDFELGDANRPAVAGHLYNAELAPPYALPAGKTRSSFQTATTAGGPGANELRFEDSAGAEEIYLNASKDLISKVDNISTLTVGANETLTIGSNNTRSVTKAHQTAVKGSRTLNVSGNQDINVGASFGDGTLGNLSVTVSGNRMVKSGGDHSESAGATLTRTVDGMHVIIGLAGISRGVVGSSTVKVGAVWAEVAGTARGLSITGSYTETIAAAKLVKAKNATVNCGAAFTMNAAAHLVKAGGARNDDAGGGIALTGSAFKVKAKNIVFEAKSKLVFRGGGGVIELTKAGMVKIKAPSITIENSKALNQIMHKSN